MKLDHIKACQKSLLLVYQKLIWAWHRGQKVKFFLQDYNFMQWWWNKIWKAYAKYIFKYLIFIDKSSVYVIDTTGYF